MAHNNRRRAPMGLAGLLFFAFLAVMIAPKISGFIKEHNPLTTTTTTTDADPTAASNAAASTGGSSSAIGSAHTPATLVEDIKLTPGECHPIVKDAASGLVLPDPKCTPGATDPAVTQANLSSTICHSGYTATVRPSAALTGKFKKVSLSAYSMAYDKTIELDHAISLELGGASSSSNLWPEPNRSGATGTTNPKDEIENALNKAVCSHKVTLAAAQTAIATDWVDAEKNLGL